jgi:hypothetical protein
MAIRAEPRMYIRGFLFCICFVIGVSSFEFGIGASSGESRIFF